MQGWWRNGDDSLDDATGTTGTIRDQIGTNHGTPMGTDPNFVLDVPEWTNTKSFQFNATNKSIQVANDGALQVSDAFSFSMWIKAPGAVGGFATAIAKSDGAIDGWTLQLRGSSSEWRFWVNFGVNVIGTGSNNGWYYAVLAETWSDNLWHHVVGVWDGAVPRLYVDNVAGTNPTAPSGEALPNISADLTLPLAIGAESDGGNGAAIIADETQFYDKALSVAEVADIFNGGEPKNECKRSGALMQLRMGDHFSDDGTATTGNIKDVVGTHDGTPINTVPGDIITDTP